LIDHRPRRFFSSSYFERDDPSAAFLLPHR
jgi:hypothetical protein